MLNIHIALNNNLCETQLNVTDILSIAIPILCVLLTLLLTIFLNFLSDRRKLQYEIKKDSSRAYSNYFFVLKSLQLTISSKNYNVDTIESYIAKLEEPTIIASKINENLITFYDLLVDYRKVFKTNKKVRKAFEKYYKSHHLPGFIIFFKTNKFRIQRCKKNSKKSKFKLVIKMKEIKDIFIEIINYEIKQLNKTYRRL